MNLVYKYCKNVNYRKDCIKKSFLPFAMYKTNEMEDELFYTIDPKELGRECGEHEVYKFSETLKKHICENFALCCLSYTSPERDDYLWNKFSEEDGFCLVYDLDEIAIEIKKRMIKNNKLNLIIGDVRYGDSEIDITVFLKTLLELLPENPTEENAEEAFANLNNKLTEKGYKHLISDVLLYKPRIKNNKEYHKENEVRIVWRYFKTNDSDIYPTLKGFKPIAVYIKTGASDEIKTFLKFYFRQKTFKIIEI